MAPPSSRVSPFPLRMQCKERRLVARADAEGGPHARALRVPSPHRRRRRPRPRAPDRDARVHARALQGALLPHRDRRAGQRVVPLRRPQDVREPHGARGRGRHDARGARARAPGRAAYSDIRRARSIRRGASSRWRTTRSSRRSSTRPSSSASRAATTSTSPRRRRAPTTAGSPTTAAIRRRASSASRPRRRPTSTAASAIVEDARKLGHVGVFLRPNPNLEGQLVLRRVLRPALGRAPGPRPGGRLPPFLMPDMPGAMRELGLNEFVAPGAKSIMEMTAAEDQTPTAPTATRTSSSPRRSATSSTCRSRSRC